MINYFKSFKNNTEVTLLFSSIYLTDLQIGQDGLSRIRTPFHFALLFLPLLWLATNNKKFLKFLFFNFLIGTPLMILSLLSYITLPYNYNFVTINSIPNFVYYLFIICISLTIISFTSLERIINSSFNVAYFFIIFGLIFYFLSFITGINFLVDPAGSYIRLSGFGGEPSNVVLPLSVILITSILKNKRLYFILSSATAFFTFSITIYLTYFLIIFSFLLIYNFYDLIKLNNLKLNFKKSGIIFTLVFITIIFFISFNSVVYDEFLENIFSFLLTNQFSDTRAAYTYEFYNLFENINIPLGFGFGASDSLAKGFNNGIVYDLSIFTSFDLSFGFFLGRILKIIYFFIGINCFISLFRHLKNKDFNQSFISLYLLASLFKALGSFVIPFGLANIIIFIFLKFKIKDYSFSNKIS